MGPKDSMVSALMLVAAELVEADPENLRELLGAAQELAEARGRYAARDIFDAVSPVPRCMAIESSSDALSASADPC